jgi:opacity protein-like surface antigen
MRLRRHQRLRRPSATTGAPRGTAPRSGTTNGKVKTLIDINGYYDFPVAGPVKPYLGAGVGVAQVKIDDDLIIDDKGDALTLQGIAGASFAVSPTHLAVRRGRYQYTGSIKVKTTSPSGERNEKLNMTGPGALVGARFAF